MKIGIIVHSQTGNTYSVAQKLMEKLISLGHSVNIERVTPVDEKQRDAKKVQLKNIPNISKYDALVLGSPVHGGSISPALTTYLMQLSSLQNKNVACLVTEFFPYPWMGGNRAIAQMKKICESKGAVVCGTGVVNWMSVRRKKKIDDEVEKMSKFVIMSV